MEEIEQEIEYHEARILLLRNRLNDMLDERTATNGMYYIT